VPSELERKCGRQGGTYILPNSIWVTKIVLNSGEMEVLVSSTHQMETINESALKELYAMRWGE